MTGEERGRILSVLIIDDDPLFAADIGILIEKKYRIRHKHSIDDIQSDLESFQPDLVLCDIHLGPTVSGLEMLKELREDGNTIPIVMMSDRPSVKVIVESLHLGANGFFAKNADSAELIRTLEEVLHRVGSDRSESENKGR